MIAALGWIDARVKALVSATTGMPGNNQFSTTKSHKDLLSMQRARSIMRRKKYGDCPILLEM